MPDQSIRHLLNFFRELIATQHTASAVKKDMLLLSSYKPRLLMQMISGNEESIGLKSLKSFLSNKLAVNDRQLYDIFERMDHRRCGQILLEDLKKEIERSDKIKKKQLRVLRRIKAEEDTMDRCMVRLMSVWVRSCRVLDTWRNELSGVRPYLLFEAINTSKTGVISPRQLFQFFYRHSQQLNSKDCHLLHSTLLRRCYTSLTLQVFCENLQPLEFGYYSAFRFNLEEGIANELKEKETLAREAAEVQQNFLKERQNRQFVEEIHKEAALRREDQLQKRIGDELRAYRELKYLTKKKYHPSLTFEEFLILEKENEELNLVKIQKLAVQAKLREESYQEKIREIQALREVQKYQQSKVSGDRFDERGGKRSMSQLQKQIKSHAFSMRECDRFLRKKQVEKDIFQLHIRY